MNTLRSSIFRSLALAVAGAGALAGSATMRADPHVNVGVSIGVPMPRGYAEVRVGRDQFYYHRGTFYRPGPRGGYYVVRAPHGAIVRELPPRCSRVYVGGIWYWRYDDIYYRAVPEGYIVVDSPVVVTSATATVAPTPPPAPVVEQTVWVGDVEYVFKDGQFFRRTAEGLVWTEPPLGALTKTLPADATSVWYQGVEYYECDDVYFHKTPSGYEVVKAPWKK